MDSFWLFFISFKSCLIVCSLISGSTFIFEISLLLLFITLLLLLTIFFIGDILFILWGFLICKLFLRLDLVLILIDLVNTLFCFFSAFWRLLSILLYFLSFSFFSRIFFSFSFSFSSFILLIAIIFSLLLSLLLSLPLPLPYNYLLYFH
jgi:hypothetical protein